LVWEDKEKIQALIDQRRTNLADVDYLDLDSITKIVEDFESPKILEEKSNDTRFSIASDPSTLYALTKVWIL
jgi:hypothetical protein